MCYSGTNDNNRVEKRHNGKTTIEDIRKQGDANTDAGFGCGRKNQYPFINSKHFKSPLPVSLRAFKLSFAVIRRFSLT